MNRNQELKKFTFNQGQKNNSEQFYKSLVSFNGQSQRNYNNNANTEKSERDELRKTFMKSQNYNFKIIQKSQSLEFDGFQSFQSIISDMQSQNKQNKKYETSFNQNVNELISCLNYNKQQKNHLDTTSSNFMRQSFDFSKNTYRNKHKEQHQNDKFIKQKKEDQFKQSENILPIKLDELNFSKNKQQTFLLYTFNVDIPTIPPTLQGASLLNYQNKLYLYGGKASKVNGNIYELNLEIWQWRIIENQKKQEGRFGHAMFVYSNNFYILGGESKYNANLKIRECSSELMQFCFNEKKWNSVKISSPPIARRNFGSCLIGNKYFMIYGGINPNGTFLRDTHFLNMETLIWESHNIEHDVDGENGIAFHTLIYIQKHDIKIQSLFSQVTEQRVLPINKIKDDAIITFGGKLPSGSSCGHLRQCKTGVFRLRWENMQTQGKTPEARYSHTMDYQESTQLIIIHGGYSDIAQKVLNDIHCIHIQTLQWIEIKVINQNLLDRFGHCSAVVESTLLIFGGYDLQQHKSSQIQVIELDQLKVKLRQSNQIQNNTALVSYTKAVSTFKNLIKSQISQNKIQNQLNNPEPQILNVIKMAVKKSKVEKQCISYLPQPNRYYLRTQSESDFLNFKK